MTGRAIELPRGLTGLLTMGKDVAGDIDTLAGAVADKMQALQGASGACASIT